MIYEYRNFCRKKDTKIINNINDIYIGAWNSLRKKNTDCVIDEKKVHLFSNNIDINLLKNIFIYYNNVLMYKENMYMLRPIWFDYDDANHFIKMLHHGKCISISNYDNSIDEINKYIFNYKIPFYEFIYDDIVKTISILANILSIYNSNIIFNCINKELDNKLFVFKIKNYHYILSKNFVNEINFKRVNNKLHLSVGNIIYD